MSQRVSALTKSSTLCAIKVGNSTKAWGHHELLSVL